MNGNMVFALDTKNISGVEDQFGETTGAMVSPEQQMNLFEAGKAGGFSVRNPGLIPTTIAIIRLILGVVGALFFTMLFYGGYRWMSAAGNEDAITEAKGTIKNAVIGIAVVFASYAITVGIINIFLPATTETGGGFEAGVQFQETITPQGGASEFKPLQ